MGNPGVQIIYRVVLPEPYEVSTESIVSADDHGTCDPLSSCNGKGEGLVRFGIDRLRTRAVLLLHPAAQLTGFGWQSMVLDTPVWWSEELVGYGFSLPVVYLVWIGVVVALYPLCVWFNKLKSNNRQWWWLSYL